MDKKIEKPKMSREELNRLIGIYEPDAVTGSDTESTAQTQDGEKKTTPEPTAESVPEPEEVVSTASVVSAASIPIDTAIPRIPSEPTTPAVPEVPSGVNAPREPTVSTMSELPTTTTVLTPPEPLRRPSSKQRKASFDEYRETFLRAPKITDRQPVFLSRETRDRLDEIVRRLGDRKMSVSGFIENLARQHLEAYAEDIEQWKRL